MKVGTICNKLKLAIESEKYAISAYKKIATEMLGLDDVDTAQFFIDLANEEEKHIGELNKKLGEMSCG